MKANYHTHSKWCKHGGGEIEDYIEEAIRNDFTELAITEHVPHVDRFGWISQEEFPLFDAALNECISKYKDRIHVIKGFECEYIDNPTVIDLYKRYKEEYGYELLIMGQHSAGENGKHNIFEPIDSEVVKLYCEDSIKGLESGLFKYYAHPDLCLVNYEPGWDKTCEKGMREVFKCCEELKIPVEFNANGLRYKKAYPSKECFLMSKEFDLKYMIGADAHDPKFLYDDAVKEAERLLKEWGITVSEYL